MMELIGSIARRVGKRFAPIAAESGLSATEGLALWYLKMGARKASEVGEWLGLSPSTISGILDRLEADGWIMRESDPGDRRVVRLRPTKKLADFNKVAQRSVKKDLERTLKDLSPDFIDRVCADLSRVVRLLEADED
jgi:DNA-binding MarR family transcriptional regulator